MTTLRYAGQSETLALMRLAPVIPVLVVDSRAEGVATARALVAGGLRAIEIMLRTPAALDAIKAVAQEVEGAVVGAGTVLDETGLSAALAAGARFLVSPGATSRLARALAEQSVPVLPGVATVSEAMALRELGFRQLKFFPAEASGGAKAVAAIGGPLPDLSFCPTGGIDAAKAAAYLALKNVACVGGSWMCPKGAAPAEVERLAREAAALRR
jgi:2-dehydro-3-deoxyphosphogluconate aldolase/(4S)-4-hydroxy-2-oxoglutarate aldolase